MRDVFNVDIRASQSLLGAHVPKMIRDKAEVWVIFHGSQRLEHLLLSVESGMFLPEAFLTLDPSSPIRFLATKHQFVILPNCVKVLDAFECGFSSAIQVAARLYPILAPKWNTSIVSRTCSLSLPGSCSFRPLSLLKLSLSSLLVLLMSCASS